MSALILYSWGGENIADSCTDSKMDVFTFLLVCGGKANLSKDSAGVRKSSELSDFV